MRRYKATNYHITLFFFILPILLLSCSSSRRVVMLADEKEMETLDATVGINFMKESAVISTTHEEWLKNHLGKGDLKELFQNYFRSMFSAAMRNQTVFTKVKITEIHIGSSMDNKFHTQRRILAGEQIMMSEPDGGTTFATGKDTLRYILFVGEYRIDQMSQSNGMFGSPGITPFATNNTANPVITHAFHFYLWDNRNGKMLFYGKTNLSMSSVTGYDMSALYDEAAIQVFEKTPFLYRGK